MTCRNPECTHPDCDPRDQARALAAEAKFWRRYAAECMKFLTREQIAVASQATGGDVYFCNLMMKRGGDQP